MSRSSTDISMKAVADAVHRKAVPGRRLLRDARWRSGGMFLGAFALGLALVFWHHAEAASQWADRPLLPRLSLWLPFLAGLSAILRRSLLGLIGRPVPVIAFVLLGVACLLGYLTSLAVAHAAILTAVVIGMVIWGRWLGIRFFLPIVVLLTFLRPFPGGETAIVEGLVSMQGHLAVWALNGVFDGTFVFADQDGIFHRMGSWQNWSSLCRVAPECSGYQTLVGGSVFAITLASSLMIGWPRKLVLLAVAILIAFFGNTVRVLVSATFFFFDMDAWAQGPAHAGLGFAVFGLQILLLGWIAGFIGNRFKPDPEALWTKHQKPVGQE